MTISELVRAVRLALGGGVDGCPLADTNGDMTVGINELVQAVRAALGQCA